MGRKIGKIVVSLLCIGVFLRLFFWNEWRADSIIYPEFEQKLTAGEIEKIVVNTKKKNVLLYEKETNEIYKMELISMEKVEELVWEAKKTDETLEYKVTDKKIGFLAFFTYMYLCWCISKLINFFGRLIKTPKNPKDLKNYLSNKIKERDKEKEEKKKKEDEALDNLKNALKSINGDTFEIKKEEDTGVTFQDVIGLDRELEELKDIVSFLNHPEQYKKMGAELPKGILLYGKSGVGKTLIARAIAGEAKVPFFQISASAFQSKYVGGTEENIRKLFNEAKASAPSMIFIDEFDTVALKRYGKHSNEYSVSFLNQLLSCMDGFESTSGVIVIAATNHYEQLDDAVVRRGRFDRHIYIHEPDQKARKELLKYYAKNKKVEIEEFLDKFVARTAGFTGSDIKTLMNEAALLAVRENRETVIENDLEEAYRKILAGSRTSREKELKNKQITAIHEVGHALISLILGQKVMEISIVSRGNAEGYCLSELDETQEITVDEVIKRVKIALAGRAAERVILNEVSAGASNDLQKASSYLYNMHLKFGMGKGNDVQLVLTENDAYNKQITSKTIEILEEELKEYYKQTCEILEGKKDMILKLAKLLAEKEVLTENEMKAFFAENPL